MTNAEARFSKSLRPRKPEGSLGRTAQDVHLDSHTAPELCPGLSVLTQVDFKWPCIQSSSAVPPEVTMYSSKLDASQEHRQLHAVVIVEHCLPTSSLFRLSITCSLLSSRIKRPRAVLTWVRIHVAPATREFSPKGCFQCRLSSGFCTAPMCNLTHRHLRAR